MAKKRRMPILAGQIILMTLGALMLLVHFGFLQSPWISFLYTGQTPELFLIIGIGFLAEASLLEAVAFEPQQLNLCSTCHKPLIFIQQHNTWFCFNCEKYGKSEN
jgi:hypothetical protein